MAEEEKAIIPRPEVNNLATYYSTLKEGIKSSIIGLIIYAFGGSTTAQTVSLISSISQIDDENTAVTIAISNQIMKHWEMNSSFWRIQIGKRLDMEDNFKLKQAWDELDRLKSEIKKEITERQAGEVLSWYLKWVQAGGKDIWDVMLPKVLKLTEELGIKP